MEGGWGARFWGFRWCHCCGRPCDNFVLGWSASLSHTLCSAFFLFTRHGFAVPGLPSTGGLPHLSPVEVALRMQRLPELQTPDEFQEWRKWMDAFVGVNG